MFEQTIGFSTPTSSSTSSSIGMFMVMKRLGVVFLANMVGEDAERVLHAQPEQEIDNHVLEKMTGVFRPWNIFISASTKTW